MIKNVVERIGQADTIGIISIVFFFTFFVGMLVWAFSLKKGYLHSMESLPLDGGETGNISTQKDSSHE